MRIVVLYGEVARDAGPDDTDTLVERDAVCAALARLGHEAIPLAISLNIEDAVRRLLRMQPALIFNLVESIAGSARWVSLGPMLAESLGVPYTGSTLEGLLATSHKPMAKRLLRAAGLPTPDWFYQGRWWTAGERAAGPFIVKSDWEHASIGIQQDSVFFDHQQLPDQLLKRKRRFGGQWFVEQYIDGREFNVALIGAADNPKILPPAEICFVDFPAERFRIVDYDAKWNTDSFAYRNTQRRYDFMPRDSVLLQELRDLARVCWQRFSLNGYVRVDFRVDRRGRPWILEVNANPCISPDAGLAAAAANCGMIYDALVGSIVRSALDGVAVRPDRRFTALA